MKKIWFALFFAGIFALHASVGAAAERVWAEEGFALSGLNRLYLDTYSMNYGPTSGSPAVADIERMFVDKGMDAKHFVVPNDDLARFLLRDQQIDVTALSPQAARDAVRDKIADYADAYVVLTIVHNRRVVIFFDVYAAETGKLVFAYQGIAGSSDADNLRTYGDLTKDFYKALAKEAKAQMKKQR